MVTNAGPSNVTGATVADPFPAALTGVTYTATQTGGATGFTGQRQRQHQPHGQPAGRQHDHLHGHRHGQSVGHGHLVNTATVDAPAGVTDPTPGNNTATDTDTLTPTADLQITKTDGVAAVVPGSR